MSINKALEDCLESVEDPRTEKNLKHKFIDVMAIAILATISGADTWDDMEDWGNAKKEWLSTFLELPNGIPSHDTFNRIFSMIELELLNWLDIKGCIVIIDAMGTQKKIAEEIIAGEADYILSVKENQPQLYENIRLYFETEVNKGQKRIRKI